MLPQLHFRLRRRNFSTQAQELKDRQLTWAYDYSTVQMSIEILFITLNGMEVRPGEKIKGDENWLKDLTFKIKNISDQPISFLNIHFTYTEAEWLCFGISGSLWNQSR